MSFRCEGPACETIVQPSGVKPIMQVVMTRSAAYSNTIKEELEDGRTVSRTIHSGGHETVKELALCHSCAGVEVKESLPEMSGQVLSDFLFVKGDPTSKRPDHRKGCKRTLADCELCQRYVEVAARLPLNLLAKALQQPQAVNLVRDGRQ